MQQVVLFFPFEESHLELGVLVFLLHGNKLAKDIFEDVAVFDTTLSFFSNIVEHIFQAN
jgi:hypothetical protein